MKIAVDITPIDPKVYSGHKVRGVGMYISLLKDNLEKYDKKNSYTFFSKGEVLPSGIDIILYPYFEPFFLTLPAINKYKTVITIHDLTPVIFPHNFPSGIKGKVKWNIQKLLARKVDGILTDSNCSKSDIEKFIGIKKEKVGVAYLGVSENFKPQNLSQKEKEFLTKKYSLPEKFILYVGDATWNKNLPRLVEAAIDANIPLVMVGKSITNEQIDKNNPWNKDLLKVQEIIKKSKVLFPLGFVDEKDLVSLYNLAECLIMPSLYEGFGLPVLEAMKSGCPVISSREGSLPEVGGDAVLYVDAHSKESIAHGMATIFKDKKLQEALRDKGIAQASKFSIEKMIEDTTTFLESL